MTDIVLDSIVSEISALEKSLSMDLKELLESCPRDRRVGEGKTFP